MDDLISRQAAIDAVRSYYDEQYALCDSIEELIEKLPSADTDLSDYSDRLWKNAYERGKAEGARIPSVEPERKRGKWMPFDNPWYKCSECGAVRENKSFMENFCPNCGADMRGGDNGTND